MIAALRKHGGIQAYAADDLKVSRATVCKFIQAHPKVTEAWAEIEETENDYAESTINTAARNGDVTAAKFRLERRARDRGWGRNVALTGADGGPIEIRDLSNLTDEQLEALERAAAALANGTGGAES